MKVILNFMIKKSHKRRLKRLAKQNEESTSEYIRRIIEKHLEQLDKENA